MAEDFKKYDSQDTYVIHNARLTSDAQVIETGERAMVKLKFASECRNERYETLWVEATVADRHAGLARYLKKGDVVGVSGKPGLRRWGDDNDKISFELTYAEIMPSIELISAAKERGFAPGGVVAKVKEAAKKTRTRRQVKQVEPDLDLDADLEN